MGFKKAILVLLLLIFLTMGAASAVDTNTTSDNLAANEDTSVKFSENNDFEDKLGIESSNHISDTGNSTGKLTDLENVMSLTKDNHKEDKSYDDILSAQNDLNVLNTNYGTYSGLTTEIGSGGNIELNCDYYTYDSGDTITISTPNSVINGKGAIIDMAGSPSMRAFEVTASGVTIKNLTIKNANYNGNGGAIYFSNSGTVTNCNFINNYAYLFGGAIYFDGDGNVTNCTFTNNTADDGAVYFTSNGTVTNCNFTANTATVDGGAVYFTSNGTVTNCNFTNNTANSEGGAIYFYSDSKGNVTNCNFIANSDSGGGAVYFQNTGTVSNCNFINNNAYYGGAVCFWGEGSVANCNFTNNTANSEGGAIFFDSDSNGNVTNCNFINCSAELGKAIYANSNTLISNCNFETQGSESLSELVVGGITSNCTVNGNKEKTETNMTVTVDDITYGENATFTVTLPSDATGILNITVGNMTFTADVGNEPIIAEISGLDISTYIANITYTGDLKYLPANASTSFTVSSKGNKTFTDLKNLIDSASPEDTIELDDDYTNDGSITADGITISKAITIDGKGHTLDAKRLSRIFEITSADVTLKNIIFRNGFISGQNYGGAIHNNFNGNILNCSFVNCSAHSGGAVAGYGDQSNFSDCSFVNCSSSDHSGAVDWSADCNVFNCIFINCSARYGGAFACGWIGDNSIIYNCTFINCSSSSTVDSGGAIWFIGSYLCNVVKCSFVNCSSKGEGGGIYFYGEGNISDSSFENCHASQGGALYFNNGGNGYNCNFTNCSADNNGGAVYWTGNNGKIESSNFIKCNAENGRAIYVSEGRTVNILKSKFDNADSIYGGTISNCTFGEKTNPDMTVTVSDITIGENLIINVTMVNDSPQAVYLNIFKADTLIDWVHITARAFDGHADWEFSNLKIGEYLLNVEFVGDEKYESATCNMTFTVRPKVVVPEIVPEATNMNIYMDFGENITDTIVIKIDKKTFDVLNIKQGIVNESTKTVYFSTGNHIATFSYEGDLFDANLLNHMGSPIEYNIEIVPVEIPIEEEIETGTDGVFTIEVPINATGKLTIFIDGQAVQTLDVEEEIAKFLYETQGQVIDITVGILKIDLSKYKGKFTVTFEYSGDENFHAFTKEANVTVSNPSITATPTKALYTAGQTYTIKVYIATGILAGKEKVIVKVNGKSFKTLTTTNGIATFKITQTPGTYKLKITSLGKTIQKTLTVKHIVTLKTVKVKKSAKKLILQATLAKVNKKYLKNKQIIFKFNGKKYKAKTNKKGVAKVTIKKSVLKKLKVGKKITYQATYLKDTVKKTAKIKK